MRRRALALAAVALLAAGCELRLDVRVVLDRDGGGSFEVAVAADDELGARAADAGADPLGTLREAIGGTAGWSVRDDALADGGRRVVAQATFDDPAELAALSSSLSEGLSVAEAAPLLQPFTLEVGEERLRLVGSAAAVPSDAVADLGTTPAALVEQLRAAGAVRYGVEVVLPAAVLQHDAASVEVLDDGRTALRWDVPVGDAVGLTAVGERPRPPYALYAAAAAGGVLVLIALAVGVLAARRS